MKKLVIITDAWTPQVNGVITSIERTKEILEKRGYSVRVIHPGLFKTIPVPLYPELPLSLTTGRRLHKILVDERPDFVHITTEGPLGFAARRGCIKARIPFTTAYHTNFPLYISLRIPFTFRLSYAYLRWFHSAATRVFASTDTLKKELETHGFKNVVVTPLGVDPELFRPHINPALSLPQRPLFTYVGRVAMEKNIEEFLECDLPGTKIVIGDGPDRAHLEKKYRGTAVFLGYKTKQDLVDWLTASDVFVLPSRTETFGLVMLEALACGVPVAAHDCMGPRDIIRDGVTGKLDENLARAARACLGLNKDECRKGAIAYSWTHAADAFEKYLAPIISPVKEAPSGSSAER